MRFHHSRYLISAALAFSIHFQSASAWNPRDFDAAKDAGMRYIVITAKHHDGFSISPTIASNCNLLP